MSNTLNDGMNIKSPFSPDQLAQTQTELLALAGASADFRAASWLVEVALNDEATETFMITREAALDRTHPRNMDGLYPIRKDTMRDTYALARYAIGRLL